MKTFEATCWTSKKTTIELSGIYHNDINIIQSTVHACRVQFIMYEAGICLFPSCLIFCFQIIINYNNGYTTASYYTLNI